MDLVHDSDRETNFTPGEDSLLPRTLHQRSSQISNNRAAEHHFRATFQQLARSLVIINSVDTIPAK